MDGCGQSAINLAMEWTFLDVDRPHDANSKTAGAAGLEPAAPATLPVHNEGAPESPGVHSVSTPRQLDSNPRPNNIASSTPSSRGSDVSVLPGVSGQERPMTTRNQAPLS